VSWDAASVYFLAFLPAVFYQHTAGDAMLAGYQQGEGGKSPVLRGVERPDVKYAETLQVGDWLLLSRLGGLGPGVEMAVLCGQCAGGIGLTVRSTKVCG